MTSTGAGKEALTVRPWSTTTLIVSSGTSRGRYRHDLDRGHAGTFRVMSRRTVNGPTTRVETNVRDTFDNSMSKV
jgi:hypothetical protein